MIALKTSNTGRGLRSSFHS